MGPRRGKADDRQQTLQPSAMAQAAAAEAQQQQLQQLQQQQESFCIAGHDCYFPHKPYGECVELPACSTSVMSLLSASQPLCGRDPNCPRGQQHSPSHCRIKSARHTCSLYVSCAVGLRPCAPSRFGH